MPIRSTAGSWFAAEGTLSLLTPWSSPAPWSENGLRKALLHLLCEPPFLTSEGKSCRMDRGCIWSVGWICPMVGLWGVMGLWFKSQVIRMYCSTGRKAGVRFKWAAQCHGMTVHNRLDLWAAVTVYWLTQGTRPRWISTLYLLQDANWGTIWSVGSGFDPVAVNNYDGSSHRRVAVLWCMARGAQEGIQKAFCLIYPLPLPWSNAGQQRVWKIFHVLRHYSDEFGVSINGEQWAEDEERYPGLRCSWLMLSWKKVYRSGWNIDPVAGRLELQQVWHRCLTVNILQCFAECCWGLEYMPLCHEHVRVNENADWEAFKADGVCFVNHGHCLKILSRCRTRCWYGRG